MMKNVLKNTGESFTLRGDDLKVITNDSSKTTKSPDVKLNTNFMNEVRFDRHARGRKVQV